MKTLQIFESQIRTMKQAWLLEKKHSSLSCGESNKDTGAHRYQQVQKMFNVISAFGPTGSVQCVNRTLVVLRPIVVVRGAYAALLSTVLCSLT